MFDWDDLRTVLALARARSLEGAAAATSVNKSTVFRRLARLEQELGTRLFERLPEGYVPTVAGEEMLATATRIEEEARALDLRLKGNDCRLSGTLRVTTSECLAYRVLTRHLTRVCERHPDIEVELIIDDRNLNLSHREADVALRPMRPSQGYLFGRKISAIAWALYGEKEYVGRCGGPDRIAAAPNIRLVGWDDPLAHDEQERWLHRALPKAMVRHRSNSLFNHFTAAASGLGLALLPCYMGDPEPALVRLGEPIAKLARELWLVTHEDLRRTARVEAFLKTMGEAIETDRPLLEGAL